MNIKKSEKLTYKKVFMRYKTTISDQMSQHTYYIYKRWKLNSKRTSFSELEKFQFDESHFKECPSSDIPEGYNYKDNKNEKGSVKLKYIDFYDYLPKENLDTFKKQLKASIKRNKKSTFSTFGLEKDFKRIDNMGRYIDGCTFYRLADIKPTHSDYMEKYSDQISVSLRNLSTSFLVVKYRFYMSEAFSDKIDYVCKKKYKQYTNIIKSFDTHWYNPKKFGRSFYTGDNARQKYFYNLLTDYKWNAFKELKKNFNLFFEKDGLFPPTFDTYMTNFDIKTIEKSQDFLRSILLDFEGDYSEKYSLCICWNYKRDYHEGARLSSFSVESVSQEESFSEIALHEISDLYAVYLTANSIRWIAERDIAECNKLISKSINKSRTNKILKSRIRIKKKLYYSYRFISEFTGESLYNYDFKDGDFKNLLFDKRESFTKIYLMKIEEKISNTRRQIDNLLQLLDDAAEYSSVRYNIALQKWMIVITIISLLIAAITVLHLDICDIIKWFRRLFAR